MKFKFGDLVEIIDEPFYEGCIGFIYEKEEGIEIDRYGIIIEPGKVYKQLLFFREDKIVKVAQ